jgi:hypothetical protein
MRTLPPAALLSRLPARACLGALALAIAACGGSAQTTPPTAAPPSSEPPDDSAAEESGTLDVVCDPPVPVLLDGKPSGTSPVTLQKVAPGKHDVTCADEQAGSRTMPVIVAAGENKTVKSGRAPGIIEGPRQGQSTGKKKPPQPQD